MFKVASGVCAMHDAFGTLKNVMFVYELVFSFPGLVLRSPPRKSCLDGWMVNSNRAKNNPKTITTSDLGWLKLDYFFVAGAITAVNIITRLVHPQSDLTYQYVYT